MENPERSSSELALNLVPGDVLMLKDGQYEIEKVELASDLAPNFGLHIDRYVPIYFVNGFSSSAQGGYSPDMDIIVIFKNMTDPTTLEHELIHAVEYQFSPTPELLALYEKAKEVITESSFEDGFFNWNFMKNIHEFIADGKTKLAPVLKKEGLWDDFVKETEYIFE